MKYDWQRYSYTFKTNSNSGYEPLRFYVYLNTGSYGYDTASDVSKRFR